MKKLGWMSLCLVGTWLFPGVASATKSAELYSGTAYGYGRFEARVRMTAGDGVVSAFFLWKDGSEQAGMYWNELDFEKIGANCQLQTNALYGNPSASHTQKPDLGADLCGDFHVYGYEWTADYIAWSVDGTEVRRETGATATAYADNASAGMQVHFNIWPGDASFGGNFDPNILPVHEYIDWVQFSSYADGAFTLDWREDFSGSTAPSGWYTGDWGSPKNLSTHDPLNVNFLGGYAVLSLTADDATGPAGAMSGPDGDMGGMGGTSGSGGASAGTSGGSEPGGGGMTGDGGTNASGATGGMDASGGTNATGGVSGTGPSTEPTGGTGTLDGGSSGSTSSGGTAGTEPSGSSATGGTPTTGGSGATTGAGAPTGSDPTTGAGTTGAPGSDGTEPGGSEGCGCRIPRSQPSPGHEPGIGATLVLALAALVRRRRAART